MAYSPKHRYKSRHERYISIKRNTKAILVAIVLALILLIYKNWIYIMDTLNIYF